MRERWVGWSVVGLLVAAAALLLDPATFGLSTYQPFAQLVALRGLLAIGALVAAATLIGCALLVAHRGEQRPNRLLVASCVLLLLGGANAGVLLVRGASAESMLPDHKQPGDVDVLAFNSLGGGASRSQISALLAAQAPDVVALPETSVRDAQAIAGDDFAVFVGMGSPGGSPPTALLVSTSLGEYHRIDGPDLEYGMVGVAPADGSGPTLYGVHVVSPIADRMALWRDELDLVTGICDDTDGIIMAGDFNATVDHAPLRGTRCVNGTDADGGVGTWPSGWPSLLGAPIDHVLADPDAWQPVASAVTAVSGSDHRAIIVRLRPH